MGPQLIANLPQEGVTPHKPLFTHIGMNVFGPLEVKQGRKQSEAVQLFIHLINIPSHTHRSCTQLEHSLFSALRKFINLKGLLKKI